MIYKVKTDNSVKQPGRESRKRLYSQNHNRLLIVDMDKSLICYCVGWSFRIPNTNMVRIIVEKENLLKVSMDII